MTDSIKLRFAGRDDEFTIALGQNLLEVALAHHVDVDHACGGVCACSTCHIKVTEGADALSEASEEEEDQLDEARDVDLSSRLACQAVVKRAPKGGVIEVAIPRWNVNLVQEGH